jgi:hypothetical protein
VDAARWWRQVPELPTDARCRGDTWCELVARITSDLLFCNRKVSKYSLATSPTHPVVAYAHHQVPRYSLIHVNAGRLGGESATYASLPFVSAACHTLCILLSDFPGHELNASVISAIIQPQDPLSKPRGIIIHNSRTQRWNWRSIQRSVFRAYFLYKIGHGRC